MEPTLTVTESGKYVGFDHIVFWVGNARQAASYYCTRMGFQLYGYRGLETGHRDYASHVIKQDKIFFVFQSPLQPDEKEMNTHIMKHGDGVKDVAFTVDNCRLIFQVFYLHESYFSW